MTNRLSKFESHRVSMEGVGCVQRYEQHESWASVAKAFPKGVFMSEETARSFLRRLREAHVYSRALGAKHNDQDAHVVDGLQRMIDAFDWALESAPFWDGGERDREQSDYEKARRDAERDREGY